MAGKKGGRSSKTDHVLSLLAGGTPAAEPVREQTQPAAPAEETAEQKKETRTPAKTGGRSGKSRQRTAAKAGEGENSPQESSAASPRRTVPPILEVARENSEALSRTIHDALNQALEEEMAQSQPEPVLEPEPEPQVAPQPEPVPQRESEPQPEPVSEPEPQPESEPEPAPTSEAQPESRTEPTPASQPGPEPEPHSVERMGTRVTLPDGGVYINVMAELVEEPLEKYVRLFGLCDCPRCMADVRALALSRLPSKYVVLSPTTMVPLMSFYQAKFESAVIAQVIYACKAVMENPRHQL